MIDQRALERAIRRNDSTAVAQLYRGAGEADRKATRPLLAALRKEQAEYWRTGRWPGRPFTDFALDTALLATTPTAEGAARVLRFGDHPGRLDVIVDRRVPWLPKLLTLLTTVTITAGSGREEVPWGVVDALLARCGLTHLDTPDYALNFLRRQDPLLDPEAQLAADPALPGLLLRALESDRLHDAVVSEWLNPDAKGRERRWAAIAADWAARGVLDRGELHRGLVAALVRGGMQPHVRAVLWILEELAFTPAEVRELLHEYLALLDSRHSFVATHALTAVRRVDSAQRLEAGIVVDACGRLLTRADSSLPKAALAWLRVLSRREPSSSPEVARALTAGLTHPKRAVQEGALRLIEELGPLDAAAAGEVSWALDAVEPTVRGVAVRAASALPELPPLPDPAPLPPVGGVDELLDLTRRIATVGGRFGDDERLLDGVAAFGALLSPAEAAEFGRHRPGWGLAETLIDGVTRPGVVGRLLRAATGPLRVGVTRGQGERAAGVLASARAGVAAGLLSYPRDSSGLVDPDEILARLRRALVERRRIPASDLETAWLRLPLALPEGFVDGVEAVGGPDAAALAHAIRRPLSSPRLELELVPGRDGGRGTSRVVGSWDAARGQGGAVLASWAGLPGLPAYQPGTEVPDVALFPTQRELLAAHLSRTVSYWSGDQATPLALLPHQQGALGPVTGALLALAASSTQAQVRAGALDATLGLLATGGLTGATTGPTWALLVNHDQVSLPRWRSHLQDVAASSMAGTSYSWAVLRAVLIQGLAQGLSRRAGIADLIGLAAEVALASGARGDLPGLDEVADRSGRSRLTTEARRLRRVLRGGSADD